MPGPKKTTAKPLTQEQSVFLDDCREAFLDMCLAAETAYRPVAATGSAGATLGSRRSS